MCSPAEYAPGGATSPLDVGLGCCCRIQKQQKAVNWVLLATEGNAAPSPSTGMTCPSGYAEQVVLHKLGVWPCHMLLPCHMPSLALRLLLSAAGKDCILTGGSLPGAADGCPAASSHCPSSH